MSKAVMISIRPHWCEKIASGEKTIEVRKTRPKLGTPFKCYIYCTKPLYPHEDFLCFDAGTAKVKAFYGGGKVIGEFVCDSMDGAVMTGFSRSNMRYPVTDKLLAAASMTCDELSKYGSGRILYFWHISNLKIYNEPKKLNSFIKAGARDFADFESDELCAYCDDTNYGEMSFYSTPNGPVMCEGRYCVNAYQTYLKDEGFLINKPPQSWCYVELLGGGDG